MRTPRQQQCHTPTKPYVVLVTYPQGTKHYAYWCDIPGITPGARLVINNATCLVQSIVANDPRAVNWVPGSFAVQDFNRRAAISKRLHEIEKEEQLLDRWSKLRSPEAKRLVKELRSLQS